MPKKEDAKKEISKLIEKYRKVVSEGKLDRYNRKEENTKKDFILPLFKALGWRVDDSEEVSAEDRASKGRVDYGFRINGILQFVVEAKPLNADINDKDYAEQAINYAWHKGCTWAVLTTFAGIKLFNAWRKAPPHQCTCLNLSYDCFEKDFDDLWLLSKESFETGAFHEWAKKYGKELKKPVGEQLLADFIEWRTSLSKDVVKYPENKKLLSSEEDVDEAVQRVLDRIVFIRSCEDKEFEEHVLRQHLNDWIVRQNRPLAKVLNKVFVDFNADYDSKLFRPHLCDQLKIGDDILKRIINATYDNSDNNISYDFAYIDADVLGSIYENYLGYILKKTEKRVKVTEKHAHRKELGIYYTPTYIVGYIVHNTLGELLSKTDIKDIPKIKVLDPACGSGSFLIKAFDILCEAYEKKTKSRVTFAQKKSILLDNLHGVDLDPKAVEIAQLNLLLKAAEKKRELPMLDDNIKCGNSLIDDEKIAPGKAFKWNEQFPEIMKRGGFDVVVGNPPYVNAIELTKTVGEDTKKYWKNKYYSAKGTFDIYVLFFEQALNVCKETGYVSFITPNKYLSSPYGIALRELISRNYTLTEVLDLSRVKVFDDPSVYPIITIIKNIKPKKEYSFYTSKLLSENLYNKVKQEIPSKTLTMFPENIWGVILSENSKILERIYHNFKTLDAVAEVQATSTAAEADEYSKLINTKKKGLKIVYTGTIDRYSTTYEIVPYKRKAERITEPHLDVSKISEVRRSLYNTPKIIIAKLAARIEGFLDSAGEYASLNTNCIHSPKRVSLEYLVGLINSNLMSFVYSQMFAGLKMSGGYFQFQAPQLRVLPIAEASQKNEEAIVALVSEIMTLKNRLVRLGDKQTDARAKLEAEIKKIDAEIDDMVYKIYGITDKERKIIEESLK